MSLPPLLVFAFSQTVCDGVYLSHDADQTGDVSVIRWLYPPSLLPMAGLLLCRPTAVETGISSLRVFVVASSLLL